MSSEVSNLDPAPLLERISAHSARIGVVGLGTIGLPLATFAAARGFRVTGLDIDRRRVADVNARTVLFEYTALLADLPADRLRATTDAAELADVDIVFFCVPTPVDERGYIQLDRLEAAAKAVGPQLRKGTLVVLESSVEIRTTRWFLAILEAESGLRAGTDLHVAYCPERYNPGLPSEQHAQIIYGKRVQLAGALSYHHVPRVVGGLDAGSGEVALRTYEAILEAPVKLVATMEVAEAAKLMENIFRDVNIALMNEFSRTLTALGVDTYDVIQAASTKSFAFLAHSPGLVGGECIPVDTWYLIRQAEREGVDCTLMRAARSVNDGVVDDVVKLTLAKIENAGHSVRGAKVAILGTAYKANVFDDRVSPSRQIAAALKGHGIEVAMSDPIVKEHNHRTKDILVEVDDALRGASVAILATDHKVFKDLAPAHLASLMRHKAVVDARNALDHEAYRRAGFALSVWGKTDA